MNVIRLILGIIFPPLGAFFTVGIMPHFWLNIILTLCGYIPGVIHVLYLLTRK